MGAVRSRMTPGTLVRISVVLAMLGLIVAPISAGALVMTRQVRLVSYGEDGITPESDCSHNPRVSDDGRYVVFDTDNALVAEDTDQSVQDVYRRDRTTGETLLCSVGGDASNSSRTGARDPRISDDGRYVSFFTGYAFDEDDTNDDVDIYIWDASDDSHTWVDLQGIYASNGEDLEYELSGDASTIVINTGDSMVAGDVSSSDDVYAIDVATGAVTWVSGDATGDTGSGSREPAVSDDGRYVAFITGKTFNEDDTSTGGGSYSVDVYVRDLDAATPTFTLVPLRDYMDGPGYNLEEIEISGDGTMLVLEASGEYGTGGFAAPDDLYSSKDVYSYDLTTDTFTWVSGYPLNNDYYGSRNPQVSDDGQYISLYTGKSFTEEDTDSEPQVYIYDTVAEEYALLLTSVSLDYDSADDFSMSGDGSTVIWESGEDLIGTDTNDSCDIYSLALPTPVDDAFSTDEDVVLAASVAANDGIGDDGVVALADNVMHGSLTLYPNGVFVYTPAPGFNGIDTFTYTVTDSWGLWSSVGTVSITVDPAADAPMAVADSYATPGNTALTGSSVLANDTDADGDTLTAALVTDVSHGVLVLQSDGTFTYAPATGFIGTDSFTYKANDGTADSAAATVSIAVYAGGSPVYRFFNLRTGTHFYTTSETEKAAVQAKWSSIYKYEGVAYSVYAGLDTVPLYRFYNKVNGAHLYTADPQEKAIIESLWAATFKYEGIAYNVSNTSGPGKSAIYRFVNMRNSAHFYTASGVERDYVMATWPMIYHYEGVAFYVSAP